MKSALEQQNVANPRVQATMAMFLSPSLWPWSPLFWRGKLEVLLCLLIVIGSLWCGTMMTPTMVRTTVISALNCGTNTLLGSRSQPGVSETRDCVLCSVFCVLCSHCLLSSCKCCPSPQAAAVSWLLLVTDQRHILLAGAELGTGDLINNGNIFHR